MCLKTFTYFLVALFISTSAFANEIKETTIVVIDGKALLVDINESGSIVTTYMEVPEYFNNPKDHASKVIEAKKIYAELSEAQMDQIRFISLATEGNDLDKFMLSNIADLATHYHQTYANQIAITAGKNDKNADELEHNLDIITDLLVSYGVNENDIVVDFKKDMGHEPTQFIKVVSNFKTLASF